MGNCNEIWIGIRPDLDQPSWKMGRK